MSKRKKFGEVLIEAGVLDESTLQAALQEQKRSGKRLGQILEEQKVISEQDIAVVLARQFGLKTVKNISEHSFPKSLLEVIDSDKALQKLVFPLRIEGKTMHLAMVNPLDMETLDMLSFATGLRIIPYLTTSKEIHAAINKHYLKFSNTANAVDGDWWRILVLDHQELALSAVSAALTKAGYDVFKATKVADALALINNKQPHLVITEVVMPGIGGIELFSSLQKNTATAQLPVMAYSSRANANEEARLLDMGFVDFIAKPVNGVRLVARVKRALRLCYDDSEAPPRRDSAK